VSDSRSAAAALQRLREGNARFVSGEGTRDLALEHSRRKELVSDQTPFAIVLGCSDSRVPAEIVFDQGLGDLFVIRVAGNIVAPSQVGSIEFAAARFGVRLVVVLGHSQCGAVAAALEELEHPSEISSPNLGFIVRSILPGAEAAAANVDPENRQALMCAAVRENIRASVRHLRQGSALLEQLIRENGLAIVGAEYSLETGAVEFFDDSSDPERSSSRALRSQ
jgi:carbonic anhydrase